MSTKPGKKITFACPHCGTEQSAPDVKKPLVCAKCGKPVDAPLGDFEDDSPRSQTKEMSALEIRELSERMARDANKK